MGGKEDDTTLLLASVSLIPDGEKATEKAELWRITYSYENLKNHKAK